MMVMICRKKEEEDIKGRRVWITHILLDTHIDQSILYCTRWPPSPPTLCLSTFICDHHLRENITRHLWCWSQQSKRSLVSSCLWSMLGHSVRRHLSPLSSQLWENSRRQEKVSKCTIRHLQSPATYSSQELCIGLQKNPKWSKNIASMKRWTPNQVIFSVMEKFAPFWHLSAMNYLRAAEHLCWETIVTFPQQSMLTWGSLLTFIQNI